MRIRMQHPSEANCLKCTECDDGYMYRGKKQWFCVKQIPFPQEDGTRPKWSVTLPDGTKIPTWEPGCNHKTPIRETLTPAPRAPRRAPRRPLVQRPVIEAVAAPPGYGTGSPFHPLGVITERNQQKGDLNYRVTPSGRGNFHASARSVADRIAAEERGVIEVMAHKVRWSQEGQKIVADLDGKGRFLLGTHALNHFLELTAAKGWFNSSLRATLMSAGRRGSITVNDAVAILQDLTPSIMRKDRKGKNLVPIYAGVRNPTGSIADGRQWFATYTERYTPYNGDVFLKDVMREVPGDWLGHAWYDVDSTKTSFIASSPRGVDVGRKLSEGDIVGRQVRGWTDDTKGSSAWLFAALLRLVCLNGMTAPSGQGVVQVRHSVPNIPCTYREDCSIGIRSWPIPWWKIPRRHSVPRCTLTSPTLSSRDYVTWHMHNSS